MLTEGMKWGNKVDIKDIEERIKEFNENINLYKIDYQDIVFEERVKLNCFYCKRYNNNWKCPPRIPDIDYKKVITEYKNILVIAIKMKIENNYEQVRTESTNKLHHILLCLEQELFNNNNSLAVSFIGGSCKLCKNGCAEDRCRQPSLARIPVEATGINLVDTLKKKGINIEFPIKEEIYRYGMLLW